MKKYIYAGFTLPELLAVIIIIAILSSISVGAYRRSVEQSRFHEGLSVASALIEAVNQSHFDDQMDGTSSTDRRKLKTLDFGLPNTKNCVTASDYCVAIPHFELEIDTDNSVWAYRGTKNEHRYSIRIQPNFAAEKDKIECRGDQAFCESLGYIECEEDNAVCTK